MEPTGHFQAQNTGFSDLELAVGFLSDFPVKRPRILDQFLYVLTPGFLRKGLQQKARQSDIEELRNSGAFDAVWYRLQCPQLDAQTDLIEHYIDHGELEGLSPSAYFVVNPQAVQAFRMRNLHPCYFAAFLRARGLNLSNAQKAHAQLHQLNLAIKQTEEEKTKAKQESIATLFSNAAKNSVGKIKSGAGHTHVLFICHEASRTGAPMVLKNLIKSLCAQDTKIQSWIVCDTPGDMYQDFARLAPALLAPDIQSQWKETREEFIARLGAWFSQLEGPKVAICNSISSRDYAEAFSSQKIPVIAWLHELSTAIELYCGGEKTMKMLEQGAAQVVFVSQTVRQANIERFHLKADFGKVIKYGLTLGDEFNPQFRQKLFNEFAIPQNAPLVMGCGTIDKRKGVDLFIQAAKEITIRYEKEFQSKEKPHFVWVGEIRDHDFCWWCQHDASLLGLTQQLHFVGARTDMPDFYRNAEVFLMTSREDPFPLVSMEALGYGLPVVAFAGATGQEELLSHGGVLVPYLNSQEMALAAYRMLTDKQARAQLSQEGSTYIKSNYTWENSAEEFRGEIKRILKGK